MNRALGIFAVFLLLPAAVAAQEAARAISDDSAVWAVIERAWAAEQRGDTKWIETLLSADFVGWSSDAPAPRDKRSTRLWNEFQSRQVEVLQHELYPLSIVVHGDVAVAHYLYSIATRAKGQPVETGNGRYTDVLVRTQDGWKFLAWHGGDPD